MQTHIGYCHVARSPRIRQSCRYERCTIMTSKTTPATYLDGCVSSKQYRVQLHPANQSMAVWNSHLPQKSIFIICFLQQPGDEWPYNQYERYLWFSSEVNNVKKMNKKSDTEAIGLLKIKVEPSGRIVFAAYMSMKALKISGHWRSSRNFNEPVRIIISSVNWSQWSVFWQFCVRHKIVCEAGIER